MVSKLKTFNVLKRQMCVVIDFESSSKNKLNCYLNLVAMPTFPFLISCGEL